MKKKYEWTSCFALSRKQKMLIMKLQIVMMLFLSMQATASILSQQTVNIQLENATLKECIVAIEEQTDLGFLYNGRELGEIGGIYLNVHNKSVDMVLKEILYPAGYTYSIESNVILIKKAPPKPVIPQEPKTITISGTVTDEYGEPLPFVNIYIKGDTSQGVVTDQEGNYSITVEEKEGLVLIASFIGFLTKEFEVAGRTVINLMLKAEIADLSEVVVTGYQTISSERTSGSFQNVKIDQLIEQKPYDNVADLLDGEVTGLSIGETDNGQRKLSLRGETNFDGDTDANRVAPLIIVDGFELTGLSADQIGEDNVVNVLESINPNDIENISILKDAAAASIWGARAANGVIVITTKTGKRAEKAQVSVNSTFSFMQKPDYHDSNIASVETMMDIDKWAFDNNRVSDNDQLETLVRQAYYDHYKRDPLTDPRYISEGVFNTKLNQARQTDMIKEYSDLFLRNMTRQQYNASISQGTDKFSYFLSFNYTDENRIQKRNDMDRYSTTMNINGELFKGVRLSSKVAYSHQNLHNNGASTPSSISAYARFLDNEGNYIPRHVSAYSQEYLDRMKDNHGLEFPYSYDYNEKQEVDNRDNSTTATNLNLQAKLDIDIYKGLRGTVTYNYQKGRSESEVLNNEESYYTRRDVNNSEILDANAGWFQSWGIPKGSQLNRSNSSTVSESYRAMLNYSGYIDQAQMHQVTVLAGIDYTDTKYDSQTMATLYGYDPNSLDFAPADYITSYPGRSRSRVIFYDGKNIGKNWNRYLSYYSNAGYTFNRKYTLTGSWRLDDSNLFGSSEKYRNVPLWSIGGKWVISEEDFINLPFVNNLVLRATYGTGGALDKSISPYLTVRTAREYFSRVPYAHVRDFENEELRWEKTKTLNIGLDFNMFENRLKGSVEYYSRYTEDVMVSTELDPTDGFSFQKRNYGEVSNKGFDLSIGYAVFRKKDWGWNTDLRTNYNKNTIEKFYGRNLTASYIIGGNADARLVGDPMSAIYSYKWAGLSDTGAPQVYDENGNVVDYTTNIESLDAAEYSGQLVPKYTGSLRNTWRYKGFTLDMLLTYKFGHKFRLTQLNFKETNNGNFEHEDLDNRWQNPGDEASTDIPALYGGRGNYLDYFNRSNIRNEDASHIRIRTISLNYELKKEWAKKVLMNRVSVGFNVQNVGLLWTANDKGIDPDLGNGKFTPKTRPTYSFNVKLNF